jgi:hypothetical protein
MSFSVAVLARDGLGGGEAGDTIPFGLVGDGVKDEATLAAKGSFS